MRLLEMNFSVENALWFIVISSVVLIIYQNLTQHKVNGRKILKPRSVFLPFGLEVIFSNVVINRIFVSGHNHMGRLFMLCNHLYGKCFSVKVLDRLIYVVNDPEMLKHVITSNFQNYEKGEAFVTVSKPFLGQGIFNSNGPEWRKQRTIAKTHFQRDDILEMIQVFHNHGQTLIKILKEAQQSNSSIDIQDLFMRYTLDSVGVILFNYEFHSMENPSEFAKSFEYLQNATLYRLRNPLWKVTSFISQSEYDKHIRTVHDLVEKMVDSCIHDPKIEERTDLLAHFVKTPDEDGNPHSAKYLKDMCLNFLLAGRDTTAALLSWTIYLLTSHPEIEKKLIEEIDREVANEIPTPEEIKNLRYLKQVLNEVLRLYPSVPVNIRMAVTEDFLPDGTYVPKDTIVMFSQYLMARFEEFYGPDAEQFNPDRWGEDRIASIKAFYYFPFHGGPRICLGQQMALNEAKMALILIYKNFRLKQKDGEQKIQFALSLILTNALGMNVTVHPKE